MKEQVTASRAKYAHARPACHDANKMCSLDSCRAAKNECKRPRSKLITRFFIAFQSQFGTRLSDGMFDIAEPQGEPGCSFRCNAHQMPKCICIHADFFDQQAGCVSQKAEGQSGGEVSRVMQFVPHRPQQIVCRFRDVECAGHEQVGGALLPPRIEIKNLAYHAEAAEFQECFG